MSLKNRFGIKPNQTRFGKTVLSRFGFIDPTPNGFEFEFESPWNRIRIALESKSHSEEPNLTKFEYGFVTLHWFLNDDM